MMQTTPDSVRVGEDDTEFGTICTKRFERVRVGDLWWSVWFANNDENGMGLAYFSETWNADAGGGNELPMMRALAVQRREHHAVARCGVSTTLGCSCSSDKSFESSVARIK